MGLSIKFTFETSEGASGGAVAACQMGGCGVSVGNLLTFRTGRSPYARGLRKGSQ